MNDEQNWHSVIEGRRDDSFVYAVKSTGIFCRPSCPARRPLRKNVLFFESTAMALSQGFRPCKRCRPDLDRDPVQERALQAGKLIEERFTQSDVLRQACRSLGIRSNQLAAIFHKTCGMSAFAYRDRLRVEKAMAMLKRGTEPVIVIAAECGVESLSTFYAVFKKYAGTSPADYRKQFRTQGE